VSETLYETDYYAWAQHQAEALKARGAGGNALDYDNLAEEVADLAARNREACESQIENILEHFLKIEFRGGPASGHWAGEIIGFRIALQRKLTPTLRAHLPAELDDRYSDVRRRLTGLWRKRGEQAVADRVPPVNPYTWNDLMGRGEDWTPEPYATPEA
jgi:hypothetical protein